MSLALPHMKAILLTPRRVSSASSLLTNLISHWKLDEASGNALDAHGSKTLTDTNTVTSAAGKLGTARQFTVANLERFTLAGADADFDPGAQAGYWACWAWFDSLAATRHVFGRRAGVNQYVMDILSSGELRFQSWHGGVSKVATAGAGAITTGQWYFLECYWNPATNLVGVAVNGGAFFTAATGGAAQDTGATGFDLGANGGGSVQMDGRIDSFSYWKGRVLTADERTALYNGGGGLEYPFAAPAYSVSLSDLISHWRLDEASGNAVDAHGTNTLTDTNTVTTAAGKIGTSRQFTATNSEQLAIANNATLDLSASGFTFAGWFYTDTVAAGFRMMISKDTASAPNRQFSFYLNGSQPNFEVFNAAGSSLGVPLSAVSASTWYFVVGWWDPADSKAYVSINNAAPSVSAGTAALNTSGAADFKLGYRNSTFYWDGRIDSVSLWKRVLTSDERTALYAGASGLDYPFVTSPLLTNLISHWKLDEASGNALDAHSTNTLTDTNTVTSAAGKLGTARQFTAASSEYFTLASNATLQTGDIDFTVAGWVWLDDIGTDRIVASKDAGGGTQDEWLLWRPSGNNFQFRVYGGGGSSNVGANSAAVTSGQWYFVVGWYDAAASTVNIQIDNGTPVSASAVAITPQVGTSAFQISGRAGASLAYNGRIDSVSFWKRVLTTAERNALYNAGVGREYPFS